MAIRNTGGPVEGELLVTCRQMAEADICARTDFAIPEIILMEHAAMQACDCLETLWRQAKPAPAGVVVLAGPGNNGADALALARLCFLRSIPVAAVVLMREDLVNIPALQLGTVRALGLTCLLWGGRDKQRIFDLFTPRHIFVDGLYGTGMTGAMRADAAEIVEKLNASGATVLSLDVPSGLTDGQVVDSPVVRADMTICFGRHKLACFSPAWRPWCGTIVTGKAGFPDSVFGRGAAPQALLCRPALLASLLPAFDPFAHKGQRGAVHLLAGGPGTTGAANLAASAALHSGAGSASIWADPELLPLLAGGDPSVMRRALPLPAAAGAEAPEHRLKGALCVGPGWGTTPDRENLLRQAAALGLPGVLDADGIRVLSGCKPPLRLDGWILTPHPGEFAQLCGRPVAETASNPLPALRECAERYGAILVLKGPSTFIVPPFGTPLVCDSPEPALATAGSGDVLAGLCAALLARGIPPLEAALSAVLLHQEAGKLAAGSLGIPTAAQLPDFIGRLVADLCRLPFGFSKEPAGGQNGGA